MFAATKAAGSGNISPPGQELFTTTGEQSFVVPSGITEISAVCIGAGGDGGRQVDGDGSGGGGGALAYVNSIPVTPGETLTVRVGAPSSNSTTRSSYVRRDATNLVAANGGAPSVGGSIGLGGTVIVGTGGAGGNGGFRDDAGGCGGGGGAGGYAGAGGTGGDGDPSTSGADGVGGAGGGGAGNTSPPAGGGGGVGTLGIGASGAGGVAGVSSSARIGGSGSGGTRPFSLGSEDGGYYGGGGAGDGIGGGGGGAAVRIIWGDGYSFPEFVAAPVDAPRTTPTYVADTAMASNTTGITVAAVSGTQANDLILLFVETANQNVAAPSGYAELTSLGTGTAGAAGATKLYVFYTWATGSDSTTAVADSGDHTNGYKIAFRGVDTVVPFDATAVIEAVTPASSSVSFPDITTITPSTLIVHALGLDRDAASTTNLGACTNANLSSITERHDETTVNGQGGGIAVVTGAKATAGALGNTTASLTSQIHIKATIALRGIVT